MFSDDIFPGPIVPIIIIVLVAVLIFEIAMFVHVINNEFITPNTKLMWVFGMILVHPFIAIGYYFTDYKKVK